MAFVIIDLPFNDGSAFAKGIDHLLALGPGNTRVVATCDDKQRGFDTVDLCDRRNGTKEIDVTIKSPVFNLSLTASISGSVFENRFPIRDSSRIDSRGPKTRVKRDPRRRHIPALVAAHNSNVFRVGTAF